MPACGNCGSYLSSDHCSECNGCLKLNSHAANCTKKPK